MNIKTLRDFDDEMRIAVEHALQGGISESAWSQAAISVKKGGLGMRTAEDTALAAFISSRINSRPMTLSLMRQMEMRGLGRASVYMETFDRIIMTAVNIFLADLPLQLAAVAKEAIDEGMERAESKWIESIHGEDAPKGSRMREDGRHQDRKGENPGDSRPGKWPTTTKKTGAILNAGRQRARNGNPR